MMFGSLKVRWISLFWLCGVLSLPAARMVDMEPFSDPEDGRIEGGIEGEVVPGFGQDFSGMISSIQRSTARDRIRTLQAKARDGEFEEALEGLRALSGDAISRLDRAFWEAWLLIELKRPDEAEAILDRFNVKGRSQETQFALLTALARMEAGNWEGAEELLGPLSTHYLPLNSLLIRVLKKAEDAPESMGLDKMLMQSTWSEAGADALCNAAVMLFDRGAYQEAADMARRALVSDARDARSHFMLGAALQQLQQGDSARTALDEALQLQPDYPEALGNLAVLDYERGEVVQALYRLVQALELNVQYTDGWQNYLVMLSRELVPREGLEPMLQPPEDEGAPGVWHWEQAVAAMNAGEAQLSARHFLRSLSLDLNDPNVHNDFAALLHQVGQKALAIPFLKAALFLSPDSELVKKNLEALTLEVRRDLLVKEEEALLEQVQTGGSTADRVALAGLYRRMEAPEKELEQLKLALEGDSKDVDVRILLAQAFSRVGRHTEAIEVFQPVFKADRKNPRWMFRMAWLLLRQPEPDWRELDLAEQLARQACEATEYKNRACIELLAGALEANGNEDDARLMRQKAEALAAEETGEAT